MWAGRGDGPAALPAPAGRGAGFDYIFPRADWEAENSRPAEIIFSECGASGVAAAREKCKSGEEFVMRAR